LYHFNFYLYLYMYMLFNLPRDGSPPTPGTSVCRHLRARVVSSDQKDCFPSILKISGFVFPPSVYRKNLSPGLRFITPLRFPPLPRNVFDVPLHVLLLTRERSYPSHSFKISWCVAVQCTSERQHPKDCGKSKHCAGTNLVFSSQQ
jgi:hypothetical protein